MVAYVLHYFDCAGRAELVRLLFVAGEKAYKDDRIDFGAWPALKAASPWGSLPYLEVDGKVLGQTKAIIRYVAHEIGLGGSSGLEQALVDSIVEATRDILEDLFAYQYGEESGKEKALGKLTGTTIPTILTGLEKFIAQNGTNGHTVGGKLTTADLAVFDIIKQIKADPNSGKKIADLTAGYKAINQVIATVLANPKIAAYEAKAAA